MCFSPRDFEVERQTQRGIVQPQIIDEIHAHRDEPELEVHEVSAIGHGFTRRGRIRKKKIP